MQRLMWGATLFLLAAAATPSRLDACDWISFMSAPAPRAAMIEDGRNTILISSDDEFVTIVTYANSEVHSEWM
jgi:hypothetical protein